MVVTGRVLDHLEPPVAGALVGLHGQVVHADAEGRFGSSGVEVRLPEKLVFERIRGQVVTQDGEPVPGVTISPSVTVYLIEGKGRYGAGLRGTFSDAEGRFELHDVPSTDIFLWYSGGGIVPGQALLDTSDPLQEQRIVVTRLHHPRLQVEPSRGARTFRVLDAAGKGLPILELTPGGQTSMNRWPIEDGRTGVLAVSEAAATVVLEGEQGEIVRLPLRLLPGEVTVVRY